MQWIFVSPHYDDVAFSCGGWVWELAQTGDTVNIWTVCAGEPTVDELSSFALELQARWRTGRNAAAARRNEDLRSCQRLGAASHYLDIPDCIYRRNPKTCEFLYTSNAALNGPIQAGDAETISMLHRELQSLLLNHPTLVCPLALGNHVDHQVTRLAMERLDIKLWYYADFPYVLDRKDELQELELEGWSSQVYPISPRGLQAWQDSIALHASQLSTFWTGEDDMREAVRGYLSYNGGTRMWRKPGT